MPISSGHSHLAQLISPISSRPSHLAHLVWPSNFYINLWASLSSLLSSLCSSARQSRTFTTSSKKITLHNPSRMNSSFFHDDRPHRFSPSSVQASGQKYLSSSLYSSRSDCCQLHILHPRRRPTRQCGNLLESTGHQMGDGFVHWHFRFWKWFGFCVIRPSLLPISPGHSHLAHLVFYPDFVQCCK